MQLQVFLVGAAAGRWSKRQVSRAKSKPVHADRVAATGAVVVIVAQHPPKTCPRTLRFSRVLQPPPHQLPTTHPIDCAARPVLLRPIRPLRVASRIHLPSLIARLAYARRATTLAPPPSPPSLSPTRPPRPHHPSPPPSSCQPPSAREPLRTPPSPDIHIYTCARVGQRRELPPC